MANTSMRKQAVRVSDLPGGDAPMKGADPSSGGSSESPGAAGARRESEQRFRTLARLAPVGIFETDADGNCVFVNERWCELAGLTPDEARGKGWARALHAEDRERVFAEWYAATGAGHEFFSEYRFGTHGGRVSWLSG